jgi:hypothetical protein
VSYLEALLVADATGKGRAQRSAVFRHRHLAKKPLGMVLWQLGAEPFTAASVAWGFGLQSRDLVVSGEPRDRELTFRALGKVAHAFNRWFEGDRLEPPQIVLPNRATLKLLGRLGRRLAYLSDRDGRAPDPELVRFGRHLGFLAERSRFPGQQLVVVATDLLVGHWVTGLSELEAQNLPALDAAIEPPQGMTAHQAAALAEQTEIGPMPGQAEDDIAEKLMKAFDIQRGRGSNGRLITDERVVAPLLAPIKAHYESLTERGWSLLWRCIERERRYQQAPSVHRRWEEDVEALNGHIEWTVQKGGRYRTRATSRQAAFRLRDWETGQELLQAEETIDDPMKMIPCLMDNQAVTGRVVKLDLDHKEAGGKRAVGRPRITVETEDPCLMPEGKELYWTRTPTAAEWVLESVSPAARGGTRITLKRMSSANPGAQPALHEDVVFSKYTTKPNGYLPPLHKDPPWTHAKPVVESQSIEDGDGTAWE